jgi:hypothetical protein
MTTIESLTQFSEKCQSKLESCNVQLQRIEAALILVESKLGKFLKYFTFKILSSRRKLYIFEKDLVGRASSLRREAGMKKTLVII